MKGAAPLKWMPSIAAVESGQDGILDERPSAPFVPIPKFRARCLERVRVRLACGGCDDDAHLQPTKSGTPPWSTTSRRWTPFVSPWDKWDGSRILPAAHFVASAESFPETALKIGRSNVPTGPESLSATFPGS